LPANEEETTGLVVRELHGLLHAASVSPPYVLVGHSIAGLDVRLYQRRLPDEVDGLVLVESASENPFVAGDPVDQSGGERMQLRAGARELASSSHWLGPLPLAVIERGRELDPEWRASQAALSELSGNVLFTLATRSDHGVPFEQPQLVVAATEAVVGAARMRAQLPPCSTAVRAAGGSCLRPGTLVSEAPTIEVTPWQLALLASVSLVLGGLTGAGGGRLVGAARQRRRRLFRLRPRRHPTL
jgi:pimeloyl-ACP methyl ester carboxylesterase